MPYVTIDWYTIFCKMNVVRSLEKIYNRCPHCWWFTKHDICNDCKLLNDALFYMEQCTPTNDLLSNVSETVS